MSGGIGSEASAASVTTAETVQALVAAAVLRAADELGWAEAARSIAVEVEHPSDPAHGDYATNIAMKLTRVLRRPPLEIAEAVRERIAPNDLVAAVEVAKPGFVNLRLAERWLARQADVIAAAGERFGRSDRLAGEKIQVEYISANPTGPMTVANARGGPLGDVLANVLAWSGADVVREYYVEDGGGQVKRFGVSIAVRYRQLLGEQIELPEDGYQGEYIRDIATQIKERDGERYRELALEEQAELFAPMGIDWVVADAKRVTEKFGIRFDTWFMQSSFIRSGYLAETIEELRKRGVIVDRDGAVLFETPEAIALTRTGEGGWVLVNAQGEPMYLGTDLAYHRLCLEERGLDVKLNIWGANTQYHLAQMRVALPALGFDPSRLDVVLYQYVRFVHEGVLTRMGRRTGQFLALEDVIDTVGRDVARWFFLQSSADRTLDFDFELAVQQSNENPVYYVQYAHARIASIGRAAAERGIVSDGADVALLTAKGELDLIRACLRFPELVAEIAATKGVHRLTGYALELAGLFHGFYRDHKVVSDDLERSRARLRLVEAVQLTLRQTLGLLGVSAPESM